MRVNKWPLFVFLCLLATTVSAQKTLEKPYNTWGKDEATKIMTDSPWAKTYQSTEAASAAAQQQVSRDQADGRMSTGGGRGSSTRSAGPLPVVIRLHSALPVRQAQVRRQQLEAGYDKMSETDKANFDASKKGFLDCAICKNYYVVTLTKYKDASGQSVDEGLFQRMELKDLKGYVTLVNDAGEKRELIQFNPPKGGGDSAVLYFQRKNDKGEDLLTPQNKEVKLAFSNDFLQTSNPYSIYLPRSFDFKIAKMMMGETLMF